MLETGNITIGGVDAKRTSSRAGNDLIGYVSQDNFLFNLSVRENIRMGRPEATDAEVEAVAKLRAVMSLSWVWITGMKL